VLYIKAGVGSMADAWTSYNGRCGRCVVYMVILKYASTMAPTAPILLVVGWAKVEVAQALVPCETGAM